MEIEVNGETYQLVAGFGFLHEVNKRVTVDVPNTKNKKEGSLWSQASWMEILMH